MPIRVSDQRNGRNLVGISLIVVVFLLMFEVDLSIAQDGDATGGAPKSCSVIYSSCDEFIVQEIGRDECDLYLSNAKDGNDGDCLDIDAHVSDCLVSWRGRACHVRFSVSEAHSTVLAGKYHHGRKMAAMIAQAVSTVEVHIRQASALPSVWSTMGKSAEQADYKYYSHANVKGYAMFAGFSLVACAFMCPCLKPRKKGIAREFEKDRAMTSTSTSLEGSSLSEPSPGLASDAVVPVLPRIPQNMNFTMADIVRITGNFSSSNVIGHGAFGTVYRGKLSDGTFVAIKRGKKGDLQAHALKEFQNEVMVLSNIEHLNLVKLIGYLEDAQERILIFEYVSNGNLREHLDGKHGISLDLATRLEIAIDVAHALTYLHLYAGC